VIIHSDTQRAKRQKINSADLCFFEDRFPLLLLSFPKDPPSLLNLIPPLRVFHSHVINALTSFLLFLLAVLLRCDCLRKCREKIIEKITSTPLLHKKDKIAYNSLAHLLLELLQLFRPLLSLALPDDPTPVLLLPLSDIRGDVSQRLQSDLRNRVGDGALRGGHSGCKDEQKACS
jgi:hypothetical protein